MRLGWTRTVRCGSIPAGRLGFSCIKHLMPSMGHKRMFESFELVHQLASLQRLRLRADILFTSSGGEPGKVVHWESYLIMVKC